MNGFAFGLATELLKKLGLWET